MNSNSATAPGKGFLHLPGMGKTLTTSLDVKDVEEWIDLFELVPLVCIQCSTAIPTGVDEVAWVCAQYGQGMFFDEAHGLEALDIHYSADIPQNSTGKPYWVADGQVILERETYGSAGEHGNAATAVLGSTAAVFRTRSPGAPGEPAGNCQSDAAQPARIDLRAGEPPSKRSPFTTR